MDAAQDGFCASFPERPGYRIGSLGEHGPDSDPDEISFPGVVDIFDVLVEHPDLMLCRCQRNQGRDSQKVFSLPHKALVSCKATCQQPNRKFHQELHLQIMLTKVRHNGVIDSHVLLYLTCCSCTSISYAAHKKLIE